MDRQSPFHVPPLVHLVGGWIHRHPQFWLGLGRLETHTLARELAAVCVSRPIYVCGLARSGSTLLHEIISAHPGVATHRMKDYPLVFTPYWWRRATRGRTAGPARERAHGDKMLVTSDSPDALEEMLWMAFFPRCHDPAVSNILAAEARHPAFEEFYRNHIRKLLLAEQADRYAAKANYHVARLPYLLRLLPDARFVIPVREPVGHIVSLMRQHERFSRGQRGQRRSLEYMRRTGHFEFGLDRRPMNPGDSERVRQVERLWAAGEEVRGWSRYWAMVHDHLADLLASDERVRAAAAVVRFEDLCERPAEVLGAALQHCALPEADRLAAEFAPRIGRPDYYRSPLTAEEGAIIREETTAAASRWELATDERG